jgi:hypothetical protein
LARAVGLHRLGGALSRLQNRLVSPTSLLWPRPPGSAFRPCCPTAPSPGRRLPG